MQDRKVNGKPKKKRNRTPLFETALYRSDERRLLHIDLVGRIEDGNIRVLGSASR
jgi:hypothetical protein